MPRNGSGVYSLPPTYNPVVNGTTIDPTAFNTTMTDIANAMTASVAADGETPVTGNLPMSGFKHTGAGVAAAAGQYAVFGQSAVQFTSLGLNGTPTVTLDVQDSVPNVRVNATTGTSNPLLTFSRSGTPAGYVSSIGTNDGIATGSLVGDMVLRTVSGRLVVSTDNGVSSGYIFSGGKLGLGTVPTVGIHIKGTGSTPRFRSESTGGAIAEFSAEASDAYIGTASNHPFNVQVNSATWFTFDQVGHFYGSALHNNANLPTGTTNQYIASGTYTPTLTNLASFSSISALTAQWMRVGNVVTVSGEFNATAAATSTCSMRISLPIASTLGTTGACSGVMPGHNGSTSPGGITGYIKGDTVNNAAQGTVLNDGFNGAGTWGFYFTYVVL